MCEKSKNQLLQELIKLQEDFNIYKATTEKRYESKLKESIYTLETIFQTNPDSITISKIDDGSILLVNKSFLDISGYKEEEVIGKTTTSLNIWVDINERKKLVFEVEQSGYVDNFEAKFRMKDGSIITGLVSARTFQYNNEFCLLLITRDITDYKRLINRAILNELRFRAFFRNKESGVSILDLKGNYKSANEKLCNMLGYTFEELKGKSFKDVSYHRDTAANEEMIKKLHSGEINSFTLEKRYVRKDNTYYWAEVFVTGIYDTKGKLIETIGIQYDITQRKYETLRNRLNYELSGLIEKDYENEQLYQKIYNVLLKIFSIRDVYLAIINEDNTITYKISENDIKPKYELDDKEEILIRYIVKNKKSLIIYGDEIPDFFEKITNKKYALKVHSWQGAPIFVSGEVKVVLVIRLFEEKINFSSKQINLLQDTAKIISDLLEKRKAINEIKLLSQVLDQSPVIAIISDIKGNIEYVNKKATEVTGYKQEELLNQNLRILKSGEHKTAIYKQLWETVLAGKTWTGDLLNTKKNGTQYWSRNIISPIKNSAGKIVHLVALNLDVTELKAAELEAQKFNLLINTSQDFIVFINMDQTISYLNPGGRKLIGLSKNEDVTKLKMKDFLTDEGNKIFLNEELPSITKKGFWTGENKLKHFKTGKEIQVLSNSFLIKDPKTNKPLTMGAIIHDLTEKNEAIKALKQSEEKFKTLADNSINMIYIFSEDKFLYVNKMFIKTFGYSEKEIFDPKFNLFQKLIPPDSKEAVLRSIEEHKKDKEIQPYETKLSTKDGRLIDVIDSSNIIEFNGQKAVMGILTDITRRKIVEKEIIAAKEKAEELNRLKSIFYANMSHELRTPLVGIMGASEILQETIENEEQKEMASIIYTSGKRLTRTLNNILDLSKISSEQMILELEEVNINEAISDIIGLFTQAAKNKGLSIKFIKKDDPLISKLSYDKFIEIMDNIINNAIKFTREGEITITSEKQKIKGKSFSIISVKDTGIGIDKEDIKYIFDEYRQVSEGLARKYEGTGLGLTISKKYAELMNGTIEVESKLNHGSNFILKFPLV